MSHLRFLIHPVQDDKYAKVNEILAKATVEFPDTFDLVLGEPGTVDHYGYHTNLRSMVVLSNEWNTQYERLTILPGEHPVFDAILETMTQGA